VFLSAPLETLVAPDRARVLTVLVRAGQPLSGRTIATLTGSVSQPTVARLLRSLTHDGLVRRVPGGYELNREHLAYGAVELLLDAPSLLARRIAAEVSTWGHPPVTVALFGSTARGHAGPDSDVDLLVVRPSEIDADDEVWAACVATLTERVHDWTGAPCEILEYDPDELAVLDRAGDPLVEAILRDGVTLTGIPLPQVLQDAVR
jgi:predicted nucleotidyltransferase